MEATGQDEVSNHPPLQGLNTCGDKCGCKDNCECNYGDQYMGLECTCSSTVRWKLHREVPLPMQVPMQGSKGLICWLYMMND